MFINFAIISLIISIYCNKKNCYYRGVKNFVA